ncbi:MAG: preprotein translocase subunit YajC [Bacillota bacterium]|nr:preprotein translocase subunit YajC [Bacillota bacterium]
MFEIVAHAAGGTAAAGQAQPSSIFSLILYFAVPLAIFYFILIAPQRKKDKKVKQMRESVAVGDEVITIGGVLGKVIKIKDDDVTIESGADRNRLIFKKWAVNEVVKKIETPETSKVIDDDEDAYLDELIDEEKKNKKKK